jgi:hypothetical protein
MVGVRVLTSPPVSSVQGRVRHRSNVQHRMEALDLHVYFLTILRQQGHELIDKDPGGQSIVCMRAGNLLTLTLDPKKIFMKCLRSMPESFSACQTLPVELGEVPYGGGTILSSILKRS